jgi:hypothetical protein
MLKKFWGRFIGTIIIIILQTAGKAIKSGTVFELECPFGVKDIPNMRTYALVLNNAQKNMEITIS